MKSMAGFGGGVASLSMKTVGSDYQFTDWGGGKPVWDTSNSGTTTYALNNSNSPNSSDSTLNPSSHYGMCLLLPGGREAECATIVPTLRSRFDWCVCLCEILANS